VLNLLWVELLIKYLPPVTQPSFEHLINLKAKTAVVLLAAWDKVFS